jgi:hypothetical protein
MGFFKKFNYFKRLLGIFYSGSTIFMTGKKRGQMRIMEAILTCVILIIGITTALRSSSVYSVMESGNVEKVAENIIYVLDDAALIKGMVNNESSWESEIRMLIENLLPPDTYYTVNFESLLSGESLETISNLPPGDYSDMDSATITDIVTISLPLGREVITPLDVILVIDVSGSMDDRLPGDEQTKLEGAKEAAKIFVDQLDSEKDRVGLVTFHTVANLEEHLTHNFDDVKSRIDIISGGGWTNIGDGIDYSTDEYEYDGRGGTTIWSIILLSDGKANRPDGMNASQYALDKSIAAHLAGSNQSLRIYTIGLGSKMDIDEPLLIQIAEGPLTGVDDPQGKYYYAPSSNDLIDIYQSIAQDLIFLVQSDVITIDLTIYKPR